MPASSSPGLPAFTVDSGYVDGSKPSIGVTLDSPDVPAAVVPGRLKRRAEFLRVASAGKKAAIGGVVLQAMVRTDPGPARLGFTVTRKVGNAVVRNRTRRRLKEAARLLLQARPVSGADLVLIGRDSTRKRNFIALQGDIRRALERTGL